MHAMAAYAIAHGRGDFRIAARRSTRHGLVVYARPPSAAGAGHRLAMQLRSNSTDWRVFKQIFVEEDYNLGRLSRAQQLQDWYERTERAERPLILDIGANIGLASVYFRQRYPAAQVVAVEPDRENFDCLHRNVGNDSAVATMEGGIGCSAGHLSIVDRDADKDAVRTSRTLTEGAPLVRAIAVDEILERYSRSAGFVPFIAKIDIEGFEEDLFSAHTSWVEQFPLLIIELHDWMLPGQATSRNFLKVIADTGRDFVHIGENIFSISNTLLR